MVSRCLACGGKTSQKRIRTENWWGEEFTLVENVPAWVCAQCGEAYFDAEVCLALDQLRQNPPEVKASLQVPVYAYPEAS
ncbi:MAG: YgiT-type zinc finger protein [Armatimonadetes bacterium]|nr:YgiT-type zinc finger protein [Armatimonadota bacterium]